jgi:hypothetical protein
MKHLLYVLLFSCVLVACNNNQATKSETKETNEVKDTKDESTSVSKDDESEVTMPAGWTADQKSQFVSDCVTAAMAGMDREKATSYCECMRDKMEAKYSSFDEANKITEAELNSEEWTREVRKCLGQN